MGCIYGYGKEMFCFLVISSRVFAMKWNHTIDWIKFWLQSSLSQDTDNKYSSQEAEEDSSQFIQIFLSCLVWNSVGRSSKGMHIKDGRGNPHCQNCRFAPRHPSSLSWLVSLAQCWPQSLVPPLCRMDHFKSITISGGWQNWTFNSGPGQTDASPQCPSFHSWFHFFF